MIEAREILGRGESEGTTSRPPHTCAEVREAHELAEAARVEEQFDLELNKKPNSSLILNVMFAHQRA